METPMAADWPEELTAERSRSLDTYALNGLGIPGLVLMENAGRGLAELLLAERPASVAVVAGRGNNGGDGLVLARHVDGAGIPVRVLLLADPAKLSPDCARNWEIVTRSGIDCRVDPLGENLAAFLAGADWVVDALVGTGLTGPLKSPLDAAVRALNACGADIFAVDLPSGLNADTGEPMGDTVRARLTGTMACLKPGLRAPKGSAHAGTVRVIGLGLPRLRDKSWLV